MCRKILAFVFTLFIIGSIRIVPASATVGVTDMMFRNLTVADGLSCNSINTLFRDSRGFLWVGTLSGLNRYDAYGFRQYMRPHYGITGNNIQQIFEDYNGLIWVHPDKQVYCYYDYSTDSFHADALDYLSKYNIKVKSIGNMGSSPDRRYMWVRSGRRMYIYDFAQKRNYCFPLRDDSPSPLVFFKDKAYCVSGRNGEVWCLNLKNAQLTSMNLPDGYRKRVTGLQPSLFITRRGEILLYTFSSSDIFYYNAQGWNEKKLPVNIESFNRISGIAEDNSGDLWITTSHHGLFIFKRENSEWSKVGYDSARRLGLSANNITAIIIDKDDIAWIGTNKHGVDFYAPRRQYLTSYGVGGQYDVQAFAVLGKNLMVGTDGLGLLSLQTLEGHPSEISTGANVIVRLQTDRHDRLWVGTFGEGLIVFDHGIMHHYTTKNSRIASDDVYGIAEDANGMIWIALLDGKVQRLNTTTGEFKTVFSRDGTNIRDILYAGNNNIYAATSEGLLKIDIRNNSSKMIYTVPVTGDTIGNVCINSLLLDSRGILWMGTTDGLISWKMNNGRIKAFTKENGLPANYITAICEDLSGQIWIGTCNGLSYINLSQRPSFIYRFSTRDGLVSDDINLHAIYCSSDGRVVVGTPNGISVVMPRASVMTDYDVQVRLSGISVNKNSTDSLSIKSEDEGNAEITLHPSELPLSLHFSTLDYIEPENIVYNYRIEGHQQQWKDMYGNTVDFAMLDPGEYDIEVRACNVGHIWSPRTMHVRIVVLPPWYLSDWAKLFYFILIVIALLFAERVWSNHRKGVQETKKLKQQAAEEKRVMDMKLNFFARVNHEFRTPLTLIITPLEEFLKRYPQYRNSLLATVQSNARYLLELINQLLAFRKIDAGGDVLHYSHLNLTALAHDMYLTFEGVAEKFQIKYDFVSHQDSVNIDCDSTKVKMILQNLLSNAFKFTPQGGTIILSVGSNVNGMAWLQVDDTGKGIPEKESKKIYEMFYQASNNDSSKGGSGIGLYLVAQFVAMHHGTITMNPRNGGARVFMLSCLCKLLLVMLLKRLNRRELKNR